LPALCLGGAAHGASLMQSFVPWMKSLTQHLNNNKERKDIIMLRTSVLALAATVGLAGSTEFGGSQASAATFLRIGIGVPAPVIYQPVYSQPVVVVPTPIVVVPAPYEVMYRRHATGPWLVYGNYGSWGRANDIAIGLQGRGFRTIVERR
jgi:hypothetical protein